MFYLRFQLVDLVYQRLDIFEDTLVLATENFCKY